MAPLDLVVVIEGVISAAALGLRGNMLKPDMPGWSTSRTASLTLLFLSVVMACVAIDAWASGGATRREAAVCASVALTSVLMLVHLWRQRLPPR